MKGLLTKDFAILMQRKKTFIFLAIWAVVMCFTMDDSSFMVGWMTVIVAFTAISSLTYDEYDNCMPFLMSLPASPKIYAMGKYLFGFICGLASWIFSVAVYFVSGLIKCIPLEPATELIQMAIFIPTFMLLINVSLPLHLKFGAEKGRTIVLIIWGIAFVLIFSANKFGGGTAPDLTGFSMSALVGYAFLLTAVLSAVSMIISIKIMQKKEF